MEGDPIVIVINRALEDEEFSIGIARFELFRFTPRYRLLFPRPHVGDEDVCALVGSRHPAPRNVLVRSY
jgi:hypothetical protein